MTTPLHPTDQLRQDLHYLRGALERQQQLHRRLLPLPGAIILGLYLLSLCARRDLAPHWHSWLLAAFGYAVLIPLAVYPWVDARRRGEIIRCAWSDGLRLLLPWAGLGIAMLLLFQLGQQLALPHAAIAPLLILLLGLTTFVSGLNGFPTLLGVGLALGAGLALRLLWPEAGWIPFGLLVCAGLIGAFVEHRAERN